MSDRGPWEDLIPHPLGRPPRSSEGAFLLALLFGLVVCSAIFGHPLAAR